MKTINYAIDLGTTNSLIARSQDGDVRIFKNPFGHKEVLPSVVGFRGGRVLIGDKASEFLQKDPQNVFGGFKRKMGTDEVFWVDSLTKSVSPIELSAMVLKELKNFVQDEDTIREAVITIPASFDTVQSNATKKAGYESGFDNVVLLQEPIAACLAFANSNPSIEKEGNWLVYDLGGGTFDVAIVQIGEEELKVIDHKGDNFLGGLDFDNAIVEQLLLPKMYAAGSFEKVKKMSEEKSNDFLKLYHVLLHKAETAKKELSSMEVASIDFTVQDDFGMEQDLFIDISREEFNSVIASKIEYSVQLIEDLMEVNSLTKDDINQVVFVGGSTYIPLIKETIETKLDISVNQSVDPTNAVVLGAAYYAGTKVAKQREEATPEVKEDVQLNVNVNLSYLQSSRETEEMVLAVFSGDFDGLSYRIVRGDKGFDSGMKLAGPKVSEFVSLVPGSVNRFDFFIYDKDHQPISELTKQIVISQGVYNVDGQPLPNDICIEVDDLEFDRTKLDTIFKKNDILPLKKKIYKEISKTILKSSDDRLLINVLEGDGKSSPASNMVIGCIEIKPSDLEFDLIKGSEVEITLEISESRDLAVKVFLSISDQEFGDVFSTSSRSVNLSKMEDELRALKRNADADFKRYESEEQFEILQQLVDILREVETLLDEIQQADTSLNSDLKYHLDERKRKVSQKYDTLENTTKGANEKNEYLEEKAHVLELFEKHPNLKTKFQSRYNRIIASEEEVLRTDQYTYVNQKTHELRQLRHEIGVETPDYLVGWFYHFRMMDQSNFKDWQRAQRLFASGDSAIDRGNYGELRVIISNLYHLVPEYQKSKINIKGTGLE